MNFIANCLNGAAEPSEIHEYINAWHIGESELTLHEYLGMTKSEYNLFVKDESKLQEIINAHKTEKS